MVHKGGKRAKKLYHGLKLSVKMKEHIEDLPHSQLRVLLAFIRALMASSKGHTGRGHSHSKKASHSKSRSHKLRAGIHRVSIRGKMRNVRVLSNGKWRFMKG